MNLQTVLGSGGAIGIELAKALKEFTSEIRLVTRNPKKVNDTDELIAANLLEASEVQKAIKGSSVVYITIGFEYSLKVWQKNWPTFMRNVIAACIEQHCKLVFFDNIYMYDADQLIYMT